MEKFFKKRYFTLTALYGIILESALVAQWIE